VFADLEAYPHTKARVFADPGRKHRKTPACNGPISMRDVEAPRRDAQRLQHALRGKQPAGLFLSSASPGVTSFFFRNDFYPNHQDYVFALAEALRHEYEAIVNAGAMLQVDCPDLAMGRHTQFADLDVKGFRDRMELHIEALNRALVNIPADQVRMHLCWATTRARTTATCRSPTSSTSCGRPSRTPSCSRPPIRATPTSGRCSSM